MRPALCRCCDRYLARGGTESVRMGPGEDGRYETSRMAGWRHLCHTCRAQALRRALGPPPSGIRLNDSALRHLRRSMENGWAE